MTNNKIATIDGTLTYAQNLAQAEGALSDKEWAGARTRWEDMGGREAHVTFARHRLVGALGVRGAQAKDIAQGLSVGASQVSNMRKANEYWAQVDVSNGAASRMVTLATGSRVAFFTLFTNPDRGIRDAAGKSDAWQAMLDSLTPEMGDDERVAAVVAYVNGYTKPAATPDTFVDKLARVAKAADAGIELSADERAAVAQMLADIAHATGLAQNVAALANA